jgi:hypothetical protein
MIITPDKEGEIMSDKFDEVWMTYDEAAKALGIKKASVQRRAALRKWPKRKGNNKKVQVGIPADAIPDIIHDVTPALLPVVTPERSHDDIARISGLETEVSQLNIRLDEAQKDRAKLLDMITEFSKPRSLWMRIWGSRS